MWSRVAAGGANLRRMANANEDSEDTRPWVGTVSDGRIEWGGLRAPWAKDRMAAEPELFEPATLESFESEAKQDDMADALMLVSFFKDTYVV